MRINKRNGNGSNLLKLSNENCESKRKILQSSKETHTVRERESEKEKKYPREKKGERHFYTHQSFNTHIECEYAVIANVRSSFITHKEREKHQKVLFHSTWRNKRETRSRKSKCLCVEIHCVRNVLNVKVAKIL